MGIRPKGYTLGRKDNDGDYELSNCRWETRMDQSRNMRRTVFIELDGERTPLLNVIESFGLGYDTSYWRYKAGNPIFTLEEVCD